MHLLHTFTRLARARVRRAFDSVRRSAEHQRGGAVLWVTPGRMWLDVFSRHEKIRKDICARHVCTYSHLWRLGALNQLSNIMDMTYDHGFKNTTTWDTSV
jgi:hypothetical protein